MFRMNATVLLNRYFDFELIVCSWSIIVALCRKRSIFFCISKLIIYEKLIILKFIY